MQKHHSRLPIILILITLLSVPGWAVGAPVPRVSAIAHGGGHGKLEVLVTYSGEPDTPGVITGPGSPATPGLARRGIPGEGFSAWSAGIWIRLLQVRLFGF